MAEVKAGDLDLSSFNNNKQRDKNLQTLLMSDDINAIINILQNAKEDEILYYFKKACDVLFCNTKAITGAGEYIGAVATTGAAGAAGGVAASVLGASTVTTTTGGIFGLFATTATAVVAAPATLVAGAAVGAAALGYGAYKLASSSAKAKGKEEHFKETKQEGRYQINTARALNPFIFVEEEYEAIKYAYAFFKCIPETSEYDKELFLKLFDSKILNQEYIRNIREGDFYKEYGCTDEFLELNDIKYIRNKFLKIIDTRIESFKQKYKEQNTHLIKSCVALMEINNEFITPRLEQGEIRESIDDIQKCDIPIHNGYTAYEQLRVLFGMYKMLLNHPKNTQEQIKMQQEKMIKKAKGFGKTELLNTMLKDKRAIKLDETNYIKYLKEIVSVLDEDEAIILIKDILKDLESCMLVDNTMEDYEKEILQSITNTFAYLR